MMALSKRLQAQSLCPYLLQQLLTLHGHKKPEFLSGLVGSKTFLLSFLDRLLLKKSK